MGLHDIQTKAGAWVIGLFRYKQGLTAPGLISCQSNFFKRAKVSGEQQIMKLKF